MTNKEIAQVQFEYSQDFPGLAFTGAEALSLIEEAMKRKELAVLKFGHNKKTVIMK